MVQAVRAEHLTKRFGEVTALDAVSLTIQAGELFTLLGPSGCGKTTLLRMLAGLEEADGGAVWFGDRRVDSEPAHRRNIGMVFQNYAIFPHLSVAENVAYGLKARGMADIPARVEEALRHVEMAGYGIRRPDQLSGGQQQRVALARALATRPGLLLMDEPLSNLDARLRVSMREEIRKLQREVGITTVYVTHDQEEALAISDRIAVMDAGRILQVGSPAEIYRQPAHRMVAAFVGNCAFLAAEVLPGGEVSLGGGAVRFARPFRTAPEPGAALLGLRPEMLWVTATGDGASTRPGVSLPATVERETFLGAFTHVTARLGSGESVTALTLEPPGTFSPGQAAALTFRAEDALLFAANTGEAIA